MSAGSYTILVTVTDRLETQATSNVATAKVVIPDVAITNVRPSKTIVGRGYSLRVNVTAANHGYFTETFNVTLYANTTTIAIQVVTVSSGNSYTITFSWNTNSFTYGNYTLIAYASPIPGETNIADNTFKAPAPIEVTIPGDVDGNHVVNILDIVKITSIYGMKQGNPNFNPNCDIGNYGVINILDVVAATSHYGQKW
jgi:flagellar hook-associated protein FlgK